MFTDDQFNNDQPDPLLPDDLASKIVTTLRSRDQSVATAESLTAGLLSAMIAGVPGASAVLRGGLVVYASDLKATLAHVPERILADDGAVSERAAQFLAQGARERCKADWGIGLTGVAGPRSDEDHPPGYVWLGIADSTNTCTQLCQFTGSRFLVRFLAARAALQIFLNKLSECHG